MSRYHACAKCGAPGVEYGFALCGSCAVLRAGLDTEPEPAPAPKPAPSLPDEQAAQLSLADIEAAARLAAERRWHAYRLSLLLRAFPAGLARPQPK